MSETFLERIVASTREVVAERRALVPLDEMRAGAAEALAPRDFAAALRLAEAGPARVIAEIKRASPSKGLLAETFEPVAQATAYAQGGAAAISVLTEPHFFLGSLDHLRAVRAAVDIPVLRKDFVLDPYQVYEARAAGADALLLICAMLDDDTLRSLLALTHSLGMEALVEAHNAEEAARAVASGARVIGVNSRDLRTFAVDTEVVRHVRPVVPSDRIFIAESGIFDAAGAASARAWGADAILVGEALMRAADPVAKARELATAPGGLVAAFFAGTHSPFVKLCGLATPEQVRLAAMLGADAIGLVFAPQAPEHRRLSIERALELVGALRSAPLAPGTRLPRPVGVFVNEAPETMAEIARTVGLEGIQLSGDESPEVCTEVRQRTGLPVLKAVRPSTEDDLAALDAYVAAGAVLLVETPKAGSYGGSGETGNWALARAPARRWPVLLAGGLSPENVAQALDATGACGVDVSSGIETARAKDPAKMRRFVEEARQTRTGLQHQEIEARAI